MPLLPRKNSLDFNPDATILASKKLSAIALENLKNPVDDPDQSTLSALQAQKQLGDSFEKLEEMAGNYHSLVLRLGNLLISGQTEQLQPEEYDYGAGRKKKGGRNCGLRRLAQKMRGGAGEYDAMFPSSSDSSDYGSTISPSEFRRNPHLYANRSSSSSSGWRPYRDDSTISSASSMPSNFTDLSNYLRRVQADRQRFRQFYDDDERNSTATPASSRASSSRGMPIYPYDDPSEMDIDDEDASSLTTRSFFAPSGDGGEDPEANVPEAFRITEGVGANFNSLIYPLIQLTRRMNILVNSRIKPAISSLSQSQASRLTDIYQMVRNSYNDVVRPQGRKGVARMGTKDPFTKVPVNVNAYLAQQFGDNSIEQQIIERNQFGDEVLSIWNQERQNLILNLTIIINSWRQNTPTGQQTAFSEDVNRSFENTAVRLGARADLVEARKQGLQGTDYEARLMGKVADTESVGAGRKPRGRPRKTGAMTLIGNGRNFYGDQINTSRDIPTIFSGALRNCPTKYLL